MKTKLIYLARPPILGIEDAEDDAQSGGNPEEVCGFQEPVKDFRIMEDSAEISQVVGALNLDADGDDPQTPRSHKKGVFQRSAKAGEKRTLTLYPDASPQEKKLKISFHQISEQSINDHGPGPGMELATAVHEQSVLKPEPTALVPIETIVTMLKGWQKEWPETKTRAQESELMAKDLKEQNQVLRDTHEAYAQTLETLKTEELKLQEQLQAKKAELSHLEAKLRDSENRSFFRCGIEVEGSSHRRHNSCPRSSQESGP